jgi:hypothetical protein
LAHNVRCITEFDCIFILAYEAEVLSTTCQADGLMSIQELSVVKDGPIFYFEPPTNQSFGAGPVGMM